MPADEPDDLSAQPSTDSFLAQLARPVRSTPSLPPGTVIGDKYVVQGVIGAGGMGEVYLARDSSLGREVAIKRHRQDRDVARLRREAQAMAKLAHPNVVTVYEVGALDDGLFVAMEYVPGSTLRGHLAANKPSLRQAMALLRMAGEGLAAAHAAGIVHRDFKPENVLVGRDGRARVSDFGLARQSLMDELPTLPIEAGDPLRANIGLTDTLPATAEATLPGTVMGTPAYMAPEQARGELADARADQFAFCVVAWEVLFGERPGAIAASPAGWPLGRVRHWRRVLAKGLAPVPSERHPSLRALLDELDGHRWWRGAAVALGAGATLAALAWWRLAPEPLSCEAAGHELERVPALRRAVTGPGAATLERWKRDYRSAARATCEARLQRAWEPALLRRAELCLQVQRRTGGALLAGLGDDAASEAERALRVLRLPMPTDCTTPVRLMGAPSPPRDPARDEAAATGLALLLASEITEQAPPATAEPWSEARHALVRARRIPSAANARAEALAAARERAQAVSDAATTLAADAALIVHAAERSRDVRELARWLRQAATDGEQLAAAAPKAAAELYLIAAEAELTLRELTPSSRQASTRTEEQAAAWVAKALTLVPSAPSLLHTEAVARRAELQLAIGRLADARADFAAAQREARELTGDGGALADRFAARAAYLLVRAGQAAEARPYVQVGAGAAEQALAAAAYPLLRREQVATREALGSLALEQRDLRRGIQRLSEALGATLAPGERRALTMALDVALAQLELKQPAAAVALLTAELAAQTAVVGDTHGDLGLLYYNLAVAHRDAGQLELAASYAARAGGQLARAGDLDLQRLALALSAGIAIERGRPQDALLLTSPLIVGEQSAADPQALAWPRLEHARALIALGREPRRAKQLLLEARKLYELYDARPQLARIDALLRELAAAPR